MVGKYEFFGRYVDMCESFIERRFAIALLFSDRFSFEHEPVAGTAVDDHGVHFTPQVEAAGYRIDFAFTLGDARLAVELDGHEHHHESREKVDDDNARTRDLTAAGWTVVRFSGREVNANARRCVDESYALIRRLGQESAAKAPGRVPTRPVPEPAPIMTTEEMQRDAKALLEALEALG